MKKITLIFSIIGILAISGYIYVRHALATPGFEPVQPKDTSLATKTASSPLDLRPRLVKKLQQLVKQGSGGLYNLSLHGIEPDILNSRLQLNKALITPDTAVLKKMEAEGRAPDDVFRFLVESIQIEGLGIRDILSKDHIDLRSVRIINPTIEVYHHKRAYNKQKDSVTFYQRLVDQLKHFAADTILIENGTIVNHNLEKNTKTKLGDVSMQFINLLIDSSTQYDKNRFLFAKQANLSMKNYSQPTADGFYDLKIGSLSVAAPNGLCTAKNILLQPRYSRQEFEQKAKTQKELYGLSIASIQFKNMDWWSLANAESLLAKEAGISSVNVSVYLDRSLPSGSPHINSFPHQLLMKIPLQINISKIRVNDLDITYEEFNPDVGKSGRLTIDDLHGTITNLTNIPSAIKKNRMTHISASGLIMHKVPADLTIGLDLARYKTGNFTAGLETKGFEGPLINPVAEPIGLFSIKRGTATKLSSHIRGDNYKGSGKVLFLYDNLHITPMKPDKDRRSGLKKKSVTSFFANILLIKDENPKNNETRNPDCSFTRDPHGSFFNLIWKTTFVGLLKTIGAPEKLAYE